MITSLNTLHLGKTAATTTTHLYIENDVWFFGNNWKGVIWKLKKKLKANFIADGID